MPMFYLKDDDVVDTILLEREMPDVEDAPQSL